MLLTIDSSVYLSALLPKDPFKKISQKFLREMEGRNIDIILPSLIPLEVANTLHRNGLNPEETKIVFQEFYETPRLRIVAIDHNLASSLILSMKYFDLKTADWIIAGTCFALKSQLISWDLKLIAQTKKILSSRTPKQWLE